MSSLEWRREQSRVDPPWPPIDWSWIVTMGTYSFMMALLFVLEGSWGFLLTALWMARLATSKWFMYRFLPPVRR